MADYKNDITRNKNTYKTVRNKKTKQNKNKQLGKSYGHFRKLASTLGQFTYVILNINLVFNRLAS